MNSIGNVNNIGLLKEGYRSSNLFNTTKKAKNFLLIITFNKLFILIWLFQFFLFI